MSSIPFDALQFGGRSMTETRVSYDKTRISGSTRTSYILHSKGGCMPGQKDLFTANSRTSPAPGAPVTSNPVTNAFKRERYLESQPPMGQKHPKTYKDHFTYSAYVPNDDESLYVAINSCYRQVFGNFSLMESERPIDQERKLRNGDICIRDFIRSLAKSEFYRTHYFNNVNQQRFIELSFKHLLGRPPLNQDEVIKHIEIMHNEGYDYHVDNIIDSLEYQEVFGPFVVPFQRCWNSPSGQRTISFINTAYLTRSFATSDNAIHSRKTLSDAHSGKSQLLNNLTNNGTLEIIIPEHTKYLIKEKTENLKLLDNEALLT